jgi:dTDP-L-rhamnose 4-epimerase
LITGGAGFVGSHLADALLERGHEVRIYDNLTQQVHAEGSPAYLSPEVEFIHGDMRDAERLAAALSGIEIVFHLAAAVGVGQSMQEIARYMETNTQGTANLLQALLAKPTVEKLLVASSMSIYGEGQYRCDDCGNTGAQSRSQAQLIQGAWEIACDGCGSEMRPQATREDKPADCNSFYALSKKDQEEMCLLFGRTYGLPVTALRYFNIYGPRQALTNPYTGVVAIFAARLRTQQPPLIYEDGLQMRDFVSIHDVVQANLLAMTPGVADGMALNIGSGAPITIREIARTLAEAMGCDREPEISNRYRVGDIRHCFAEITEAKKQLGYGPQVDLREGMEELMEWLASQQVKERANAAAAELQPSGVTV